MSMMTLLPTSTGSGQIARCSHGFIAISSDLVELIMMTNATAWQVWLTLKEQFISNKETRAMNLNAEFRTFVQGDLFIRAGRRGGGGP